MSILFATPCYGGVAMVEYMVSMRAMDSVAQEVGLKCDWMFRWNESLIQRARNGMAAYFLDDTDFERLMFIDADIEFAPDDVAKLWNMDEDVAVGIYAMKKRGQDWYACWRNGELVKDLDQFGNEPVEVDYAGTGFMMIHRRVLERFREAWPERAHDEGGRPGGNRPDERGKSFAWFDPRVDRENELYLSEDYAFCHDWRSLGGKIMCDPTVRLKHWGRYAYGA